MEKKTVKGFKAFNKGMTCRGKQYKENEEFVEDVKPEACEKGMHFCPMPLDVLNYYSPIGSEFAEVEATGDTVEHEDKVATNKLKIGAKISFSGLFNINPAEAPEIVMSYYSNMYPELTTASVHGPEIKEDKAVYEFKTTIGTKG